MKRLALLFAGTCLCACVSSSPWENYDASSYAAVMTPSDKATAKHIAVLEDWVARPAADVPPGIYAELGYWLAKVGRSEEARALFEKEIALYPYAQKYVQMLQALVLPAKPAEAKP